MTYDTQVFEALMTDKTVDAIIWTFRRNPAVLQNPKMYGWVVTDHHNIAQRVSCKIPISDTPLNNHAIIGTFTFKKAKDFIDCSEAMIAADRRIKGEFYVDEAVNVAIESGLRVKVFEVDRYICWGTPQDVETYHY
jgi:bifunctional N-acetylglucosamine-1-phosphate-uridyltransferase/glucosamine-1-phosphate-acetyltransferase GlmU-like protein